MGWSVKTKLPLRLTGLAPDGRWFMSRKTAQACLAWRRTPAWRFSQCALSQLATRNQTLPGIPFMPLSRSSAPTDAPCESSSRLRVRGSRFDARSGYLQSARPDRATGATVALGTPSSIPRVASVVTDARVATHTVRSPWLARRPVPSPRCRETSGSTGGTRPSHPHDAYLEAIVKKRRVSFAFGATARG